MAADATSIIRSTWSELAGCAEAFVDAGVRVSVAPHTVAPAGWVGAVSLGDSAVLAIRPDDLTHRERIVGRPVELSHLRDRASVMAAFGELQDTLGPAILAFGLSRLGGPLSSDAVVGPLAASDKRVRAIIDASMTDEVEESAIEELSSGLFVATSADGRAVAASGYSPVLNKLAHIGVLTASDARGHGFGRRAASAAIAHAEDAGLIPQWRAAESNVASVALGSRLGLTPIGRQFSFCLAPAVPMTG